MKKIITLMILVLLTLGKVKEPNTQTTKKYLKNWHSKILNKWYLDIYLKT